MLGFSIHDRRGFLALTVIARSKADWQGNATTDKAVDLTNNAGWEDL